MYFFIPKIIEKSVGMNRILKHSRYLEVEDLDAVAILKLVLKVLGALMMVLQTLHQLMIGQSQFYAFLSTYLLDMLHEDQSKNELAGFLQ